MKDKDIFELSLEPKWREDVKRAYYFKAAQQAINYLRRLEEKIILNEG